MGLQSVKKKNMLGSGFEPMSLALIRCLALSELTMISGDPDSDSGPGKYFSLYLSLEQRTDPIQTVSLVAKL